MKNKVFKTSYQQFIPFFNISHYECIHKHTVKEIESYCDPNSPQYNEYYAENIDCFFYLEDTPEVAFLGVRIYMKNRQYIDLGHPDAVKFLQWYGVQY